MRYASWLALFACLAPGLALAQATDEELARAHFQSASAYFEQSRYDDSAREFLESYRLSRRPELLVNAARAQERALRFDDAIATLERLLAEHPDFDQRETMRERIRSYEQLRDRLNDGDGDAPPEEPAARVDDVPAPASSGGGGPSIPGIIVLAAGGALGIATIVTGAVSQTMYDDLNSSCGGTCPADRQGDVDTGEALALTSTILLFPSVIAIGVGIVLLIVDSGGGSSESAALRVVPGPGDAGLAVQGSF